MSIYERASSKMIADAIEQHGPMAQMARPKRIHAHMPMGAVSAAAWRKDLAVDLAVHRMLELEREVAALHKWQDDLAATMRRLSPSDRAGENVQGWALLCRHVRRDFREVEEHVVHAVWTRKQKEAEEGR